MARLFAQKLADALGQQVVVDNRPGAGGVIGIEAVAKASPDGYTLMMASSTHTVLPSLHKTLPYDAVKDFAPVSLLVAYSFVMVVNPAVQARSIKELIALAKAKPGEINYASGGSGSTAHIAVELFKSMAGVNLVHIAYKGTGPAVTGVLAGETSLGVWSPSTTVPLIKAGRLRALGTTGEKRSRSLPDLPTIAEAGVPGYEASTWAGLLAPAGSPKPVVEKIHTTLMRILQNPEVKERLVALDFESVGNTPTEFGTIIRKEVVKWAKVVKDSGAKLD